MSKKIVITIDGPAASGKSSAARLLASKLDFYYLNSGLLFRALAYLLMTKVDYTPVMLEEPQSRDVATYLDPERLLYKFNSAGQPLIFFDNHDITPLLKSSLIDQAASLIGSNKAVRQELCYIQRALVDAHNIVVDGRDTGSYVFPDAPLKFYITASLEVRAQRWQADQRAKGNAYSLEQACQQLTTRDARDQERICAPLCIPEQAVIIDNSHLTLDETVGVMMEHASALKNG